MSSLKQKILELCKVARLDGFSTKPFDDVLGLLDEATKQIQENTFEIMVKDEAEHERLVREKERFFTYPLKVINVVRLGQVLAVLEGERE